MFFAQVSELGGQLAPLPSRGSAPGYNKKLQSLPPKNIS